MDVTELMNRAVVVTTAEETVERALHLLEDSDIRHLPVLDGKRCIGMLSDRDVREYRLPVVDELEHPDLADELLHRSVAEAMNKDFVYVDHLETVAKAVDVMIEYGVGALPVLHRESGELLGMLSYVDVLRFTRKWL